jgi:asparagine synthase (glutamine-hydrolysing)
LSDEFLGAVDRAAPLRALSQVYDGACADTMLNRMLALDLKFTLTDNDLPKVTGMTALAGVDVGYPLLDDELVEFAARLPVKLKLKGTRLRYFFKQALADFLPPEVLTKQKHGFGLPFGKWVVSDPALREFVFDSLTGFARYGVVRASFIDELKGTHLQEEAHYFGSLIWIIVVLEHWLRENTTGGSDVLFQ